MNNLDDWYFIGTNKIHKTALIGDNVELGNNNIINPYSVIGIPGFIRDCDFFKGYIKIGDNNLIGTNVSIMSGSEGLTTIGNNNLIMNYVNIGHNSIIGSNNEIGVKCIIAGWAKVGDNNKIKLSVTIRNRKIIGDNNIIGMCSNVNKDFNGDNWLIYGNPAKRVKIIN